MRLGLPINRMSQSFVGKKWGRFSINRNDGKEKWGRFLNSELGKKEPSPISEK